MTRSTDCLGFPIFLWCILHFFGGLPDLRAFAGFCGRVRACCRRFAGNSGRGKREKDPILRFQKHMGALVVLGDFTNETPIFRKSKLNTRTTRKFMENESPGPRIGEFVVLQTTKPNHQTEPNQLGAI